MTDPLAVAHSVEVIVRGLADKHVAHQHDCEQECANVRHDMRLILRECEQLVEALKKLNDPNAHLGAVEGERKENENVSE